MPVMPGLLKPNLCCPLCGMRVLGVGHTWSPSTGIATFEYMHYKVEMDDGTMDRMPECVVVYGFEEGMLQSDKESGHG